jgi:hypothetical protein
LADSGDRQPIPGHPPMWAYSFRLLDSDTLVVTGGFVTCSDVQKKHYPERDGPRHEGG